MNTADLFYLPRSPYSLKVRWMLSLCEIQVRNKYAFQPTLGELPLRLRLGIYPWQGAFWKRITVPILVVEEFGTECTAQATMRLVRKRKLILNDSTDIAEWAAKQPNAVALNLFPDESVRAWNEASGVLMSYFRTELLAAGAKDPALVAERVPAVLSWLPGFIKNCIAKFGVWMFQFKYGSGPETLAKRWKEAEAVLGQLRAALAKGGGKYLVNGQLTFADIAMAVALDHMSVEPSLERLSKARLAFQTEAFGSLNKEYTQEMKWRDGIVKHHFPADLK